MGWVRYHISMSRHEARWIRDYPDTYQTHPGVIPIAASGDKMRGQMCHNYCINLIAVILGGNYTMGTSPAAVCDTVLQYVHQPPQLSYHLGNCNPTYKTEEK